MFHHFLLQIDECSQLVNSIYHCDSYAICICPHTPPPTNKKRNKLKNMEKTKSHAISRTSLPPRDEMIIMMIIIMMILIMIFYPSPWCCAFQVFSLMPHVVMKRHHIICPSHLLDRLTHLLVVATLHSSLVREETHGLPRRKCGVES